MAAVAKRAYGTVLARESTPASGTYTTIPNVFDIGFPSLDTEVVDSTAHDTASATRTRLPTLNSVGPLSFSMHYDSADSTHGQLITDQGAQTVRNYKITAKDTGDDVWVFAAYVTKFTVAPAAVDGKITATVELTVTGVVTRS